MTLLLTIARSDYVLSVADRRSSIERGNVFVPLDDTFNKHVMFASMGDDGGRVNGAATFTGVAEWTGRDGRRIRTNELIARAVQEGLRRKLGHGAVFHSIAVALADARAFLERRVRGPFPGFTVHISGYMSAVREPFVAVISDVAPRPDWDEDSSQIEIPAPRPFSIHLAVRTNPTVLVGGYIAALRVHELAEIKRIVGRKGARPIDVAAKAMLSVRRAHQRTSVVGDRVSAVVLPANGSADTGLWQRPEENTRALFPDLVAPNGTHIEASEIDFDIQSMYVASLPRDGLLIESSLRQGVGRKRVLRRLRRSTRRPKAPTIFELLAFALYGVHPADQQHWQDPYKGPRYTFKS